MALPGDWVIRKSDVGHQITQPAAVGGFGRRLRCPTQVTALAERAVGADDSGVAAGTFTWKPTASMTHAAASTRPAGVVDGSSAT